MQLALKHRPRRFDDLVGQPSVQVILRQMVKVGQVPAALMFSGCRGTGKTTTARILAAALNCTADDDRPCGTCAPCTAVADGTSLDVIEVDAASTGGVDDIRALRQQVLYRQTGKYRIVIYDEAQSISNAGFNALLKTLEEPPPNTVFLILTTEPAKIPPTVASRCMPFTFNRLTIRDIAGRLAHIAQQEHATLDDDLLVAIAERADGAMRDAVVLLDQIIRIGMTTADQYQRVFGRADHAPAILTELTRHDLPAAYARLDEALLNTADPNTITTDLVATLRDVLVFRCGGDLTRSGAALAARQNLALTLDTPTTVAALKILWQLKTQIRPDDARSGIELALVILSEVFNAVRTRPDEANPGRVTLSDMGSHP